MSPKLSSDMDMFDIESLIRPGPLQNRDLFQSVHGKKMVGPGLQDLFTSEGAIFVAGFCVT